MSEKQIINLESIIKFYFSFYNQLERLWYDSEHKTFDREAIKVEFFRIKESESNINGLVNETIKSRPKKLVRKPDYIVSNISTFHLNHLTMTKKSIGGNPPKVKFPVAVPKNNPVSNPLIAGQNSRPKFIAPPSPPPMPQDKD